MGTRVQTGANDSPGRRGRLRRVPLACFSLAVSVVAWFPLFGERVDTATRSVDVPVLSSGAAEGLRVEVAAVPRPGYFPEVPSPRFDAGAAGEQGGAPAEALPPG